MDRYLLQTALSYISSEVHPSIGGLFKVGLSSDTLDFIRSNAVKKLAYLENHLIADKQFLVGDSFTVADSYLYIVLSWTPYVKLDLTPFPRVQAYLDRMKKSSIVKEAQARMATNPATVL
jgi:glutathione S-transferase